VEGHTLVSVNVWALIFDILFFGVFVVGWIITYLTNDAFIHDNPVQRAFQGNNLCIGIDAGLANIVAVAMIGLALYPITMFTQVTFYKMRQYQDRGITWNFHLLTLVFGYVFTCAFLLAPATRPEFDKPWTVYLHTSGFASGCFGYASLRSAHAMIFWNQYQKQWPKRYKAYFGLLVFSAFWLALNGVIIVNYLLTVDIPELLKTPYQDHHPFAGGLFAGDIPTFQAVWTLIAAVQPVLRVIVEPPDLDKLQIVPHLDV